jgi:hypothetical protein
MLEASRSIRGGRGKKAIMLGSTKRIRLRGHGDHVRLDLDPHGNWTEEPLAALDECWHASLEVDKALGEAISRAAAAGSSWNEIGRTLGITNTAVSWYDILEAVSRAKRAEWQTFWPGSS